jgi:putative flippase GtrA
MTTILLPVFQPDECLIDIIQPLIQNFHCDVIIVDDGSSDQSVELLKKLTDKHPQIDVLHHAIRMGKGQSLKTGINHYLINTGKHTEGLVTIGDYHHFQVEDILKFITVFQDHPQSLVLGSQKGDVKVPFTVKLANKTATFLFSLVSSVQLNDSPVGMNGIPNDLLTNLLYSTESGKDFELDILIRAARLKYPFIEVPVTITESGRKTEMYFNSFRDSFKLFFVFLRFSLVSIFTALIDYLIFSMLFFFTSSILPSLVISRMISGTFQFTMGRSWVFKSREGKIAELIKYVLLVIALMLVSYCLISFFVLYLNFNPYITKLIVDLSIFLFSFLAQKTFVFSSSPQMDKTDWDDYYNSPYITSFISRKFTIAILSKLIKRFHPTPIEHICELGGGNSFIFESLHIQYPQAKYTVVDNNQRGLDLFLTYNQNRSECVIVNDDAMALKTDIPAADLVLSIGLIEHFSEEDTAKVIGEHFKMTKAGTIVIITFPTPTFLYLGARAVIEFLGLWRFPDERPLSQEEVYKTIKQHGDILKFMINWPVLFTQGIYVVRVS